MTDADDRRERVLRTLERYWREHPQMRLGEIVARAARDTMETHDPSTLPDQRLVHWLVEHSDDLMREVAGTES